MLRLLCSFFVLFFALPATAQFECGKKLPQASHAEIVEKVQKSYQQVVDLQAKFEQQSFFLGLNQTVSSTGEIFFKKPGMMDWRYEEPEPQRFVADGRTLWFYQPDLNQVTIGTFVNSFNSSLPVSFLLGVGDLNDNFSVQTACESGKRIVLTLKPKKEDPTLEEFQLLVNSASYVPEGAKVVDVAGNETMITFTELDLKGKLSEEQFTFEIPKGVDIIDQRNGENVAGAPSVLP